MDPVEHMAVDNPSQKLFLELKGILPNLKAVSLDPTHAAMHYEQALGRHRTAGSALLRKFMAKFGGHDPSVKENIWGPMFEGGACRLTQEHQAVVQWANCQGVTAMLSLGSRDSFRWKGKAETVRHVSSGEEEMKMMMMVMEKAEGLLDHHRPGMEKRHHSRIPHQGEAMDCYNKDQTKG